jgi:hypothetical protein
LAAVGATAAGAADYEVAPAPRGGEAGLPPGTEDGVVELSWDSGTRAYQICFYSGAGTWFTNDFDLAQIRDYRRVTRIKAYVDPRWPNGRWDGFRIGLFAYAGSVPGTLLWGPKYVKPNLTSAGWASFVVAWTLPAAQRRFAAGVEQLYNFPNCDSHNVDNNRTFLQHSWLYYGGSWRPYSNSTGYYNLMIRVRVSNAYVAVAPTSLGRVKALYY